jgi:hypothetical protein
MCRHLAGPNANPTARFMALHRLMTDTWRVSYDGRPVAEHLPYRHDFEDFGGSKNFSRQFVIKLLLTNSGQCHSLPLLYKLLAD